MSGTPACGDNSAVVQLCPAPEVITPEQKVHFGEAEVREMQLDRKF